MSAVSFRPQEAFVLSSGYQLLPFRFMRWHDGAVLVTNEAGEFLFLDADTFAAFVQRRLSPSRPEYDGLKSHHFLADGNIRVPLQLLATKVRTKRSFLDGFTKLHIFVTTLRCDHSCAYCQVSRVTQDRERYDMSPETADRAIEWVFRSPAPRLKIEFQGGEPTLNLPIMTRVVRRASEQAATDGRLVDFVVATNLSELDPALLDLCREHRIHISTSLDGPPDLHNQNRPTKGRDSFQRFQHNLAAARAALGHDAVSALMTTTPASLARPTEIIDQYVELGFDSVFLRPVSPYGFAVRSGIDRAYAADRFLEFYRRGYEHIVALNRRGVTIAETYAQILLRKMLTPFAPGYIDLQSPAGTAIGGLVYNYDGFVYASDEGRMLAEMGDRSFALGHLSTDTYAEVLAGTRVRALVENSCHETMPGCTECGLAPFCGADPVFNWATQGDVVGFRPTSEFCRRQMGFISFLLDRIKTGDAFERGLLMQWAAH